MRFASERAPFASLARCIAACEATLASYEEEPDGDSPFAGAIMRTTAALRTALTMHTRAEELCEISLSIAAATARETAAAIRRHGLDERLLRCAEACERAAFLCEGALPQAA
jgi:hypothetical protein